MQTKQSITLTFYSNTRYAGGRSHHNIHTIEFVKGKGLIEAAEYYGYNMYHAESTDDVQSDGFENGVNDWNGNEVMSADKYKRYIETGVGQLELGETTFTQCELKDVSQEGFAVLPTDLQLQYIHIWEDEVTEGMLMRAIEKHGVLHVYDEYVDWKEILAEIAEDDE